jgi:glycosyltransferase involved in cell wall biosynthesis
MDSEGSAPEAVDHAAKPPHRVCIVRQRDVYEPQIQRVAEALVGAGYDVDVLIMRHRDRPRTTVVNGVHVISLPGALGRSNKLRYAFDYASFTILAALTLAYRHARRRYSVVQLYTMPDFLVFAGLVPKLLGSRVIAYMNEPTPELFETLYGATPRFRRLLERIEQAVLRFADHAITVTDQLKERYVERGADGSRISVVLNAPDPSSDRAGWTPPAAADTGEFVVMTHGSIEDRYGQDTIIEAAALLRDELPSLRVVFTGRGSGEDAVLQLIRDRQLEDVVRFEGFVSRERLNDLLHTADAGIVAQKGSPYSHLVHTYKMVDYWIFGRPVIASRLDATAAQYGDDVIEYFEPDDAADLARAIQRLHDDPVRRRELAHNGRLAQERHGWGVQQKIYLGVYDALLKGRGAVRERLSGRPSRAS